MKKRLQARNNRWLAGALAAALLISMTPVMTTPVPAKAAGAVMSLAEAATGSAVDTAEDFTYFINNSEAIITGFRGDVSTASVTIPETIDGYPVTGIHYGAFRQKPIQSISLPSGLKSIGSHAFRDCKSLKSVTIPANVSGIGGYAFFGCDHLKKVVFQGNRIKTIDSETFAYCKKLETIKLPESVQIILSSAFYRCTKLTSFHLPSGLQAIGYKAFREDYALTSIRIPSTVKIIEDEAFCNCRGLKSVKFEGEKTTFNKRSFAGCRSLTSIRIPTGMQAVPEEAFLNCDLLKKVTLPKNTKLIKRRAFAGCTNLKSIRLTDKIYGIGDQAFERSGLTSIRLNKALKIIGNGAFQKTGLKSLKIPNKVTYIGNRVFSDCNRLAKVTIPASVRGLNPAAFGGCVSLKTIRVDKANPNYTSIDGVLFDKNVSKLLQYPINKTGASYSVPSSVRIIRGFAFKGNRHLKKVNTNAAIIRRRAFAGMKKLQTVELQNGVQSLGDEAFRDNLSLKTVSMSDSVRSIGRCTFAHTGIVSMPVSRQLKTLGTNAFYQCYKLKAFTGAAYGRFRAVDGVLYGAYGKQLILYPAKKKDTSFTVPSTTRSIATDAFHCVKKLKNLFFEKGIEKLNYWSVRNCNNLRQIVFSGDVRLKKAAPRAIISCNKLAVIVGPNQYLIISMARVAGATMITL